MVLGQNPPRQNPPSQSPPEGPWMGAIGQGRHDHDDTFCIELIGLFIAWGDFGLGGFWLGGILAQGDFVLGGFCPRGILS